MSWPGKSGVKTRSVSFKELSITALGHAGFLVEQTGDNLRLAFDPYDINRVEPVDWLFISHPHFDHCDPSSIKKLLKDETLIIAPTCCRAELERFDSMVRWTEVGERVELNDKLNFSSILAYNLDKFRTPTEVFHPKALGGVGFVVEINGIRLYHAGDSDFVPEMAGLKDIDVAFLPISGTFVMTLEEALEAAKAIKPKLAIPMHYGKLLGSVGDAHRFQNLLAGTVPVAPISVESEA